MQDVRELLDDAKKIPVSHAASQEKKNLHFIFMIFSCILYAIDVCIRNTLAFYYFAYTECL